MTRETRARLAALSHDLRSCAWEARPADPTVADVLEHIAGRIEGIACDDAEPHAPPGPPCRPAPADPRPSPL